MLKRLLLIPLLFLTIPIFSEENIPLTADSAVLMSPWTKKLFYSKNPHKKLSPASTVKIMTALVFLRKGYLKKRITVSKFASSMEPSKVYLKEGEVYLAEDLLKALLLNSGNDASVALAEGIAGSEEKFVGMMNEMAKKIGAKNTHFKNSNGLPAEGQYSTAYDMALIVREAMKDKNFVDVMDTKRSQIEELTSGREIKLKNHNKSLWKETPYRILGKTGYTKKARHCFAGYIQYNRWRKVIVVMLKGEKLWPNLEILAE
ncbi:D-alanyl-D-alanine carboxypeptidase family protein [Candidatus Omnitrophota bacterium]